MLLLLFLQFFLVVVGIIIIECNVGFVTGTELVHFVLNRILNQFRALYCTTNLFVFFFFFIDNKSFIDEKNNVFTIVNSLPLKQIQKMVNVKCFSDNKSLDMKTNLRYLLKQLPISLLFVCKCFSDSNCASYP